MKNKYIVLALLPILSTGSIFGANSINSTITKNFSTTEHKTEQEIALQEALKDIIEFAQKNEAQGKIAIKNLKKCIATSKESSLSRAYTMLTVAANRTMYVAGGALLGAGILCYCVINAANAEIKSIIRKRP